MTDVFSKLQSAAQSGAFGMGSSAQPTPEQIRAGNYAKGSTRLHGMRITIETPMFQSRRGKQDGKPWSVLCMAHYGYVNGTRGADGDAVDVFVGPTPESLRVYVVNQVDKSGAFDEHKVMLGFTDEEQARAAYMNSYEKGWTGLGSLAACTVKQFKFWLKHGDLSQPLAADLPNIPNDETLSMTDTFTRWGADNLPVDSTVGDVLYELRRNDADGLLMDSAVLADLEESLGDDGVMLDAMVIEYKLFDRKSAQLLRVMQAASSSVQATGVEVSKPFKNRGTTQVAMLFPMSDGQSVSVFFHNPDSTPNKLTPTDELISWKWVLNKRDITATVAPERGQDLNPRIVAKRIMALVQNNSAKFIKANENKAAQDAELTELKGRVESKTAEVAALDAQIVDLTAQLEQKKSAANGAVDSSGQQEPVAQPPKEPENAAVDYPAWETAVVEALAGLMGIDSGDAQGVMMAQEALLAKLYTDKVAPQDAAQAVLDAARVPDEPEPVPRSQAIKQALSALGWNAPAGDVLIDVELNGATYQLRKSTDDKTGAMSWKDTGSNLQWEDDTTLSAQDMAAKLDSEFRAAIEAARQAALAPDEETEDTGTIEAEGRDNTVKTAKGTKLVTGFKIIDARKLVISHEADGTVNPDYPAEIQPRDRARTTSQAWVQKTARNLDPDSLGKTQRADTGAPIVGPDRVVESGNGRAIAIREAYRIGQADEYREWLIENADYFGVDVAKIQRLKAPVLVRVRKTEVNRVEFAVESNQDDKLAMTATEKARSDAKRLDEAMLAKLADGDLNSAANRDFVAAFLQSLGDAEAAQYLTSDGKPTSSLISRLQAALFAGAYSDDRLLEMTADVAKPEIANIVNALNMAAPDFMRAKEHDRVGGEQAGEQLTDSVELSLNQEAVNAIIGATNVLQRAKESGMGVDEFIRQGDMFGDTDPAVAAMAIFISQNNRSAKRMGTAFKAMAQFVESENARKQTAGLFGDDPASFTDIVGAANRKLEQEYGEGLFAIDQSDLFSQAPKEPEQAPPPEPENNEDDKVQEAKAFLDSVIDGSANMGSPELLKEFERIYEAYGEGELRELFTEASDTYRNYALKATAGAF